MRYINGDHLKKLFTDDSGTLLYTKKAVLKRINEEQTQNVLPRTPARIIKEGDAMWCSCCGEYQSAYIKMNKFSELKRYNMNCKTVLPKFCLACGARFDENLADDHGDYDAEGECHIKGYKLSIEQFTKIGREVTKESEIAEVAYYAPDYELPSELKIQTIEHIAKRVLAKFKEREG